MTEDAGRALKLVVLLLLGGVFLSCLAADGRSAAILLAIAFGILVFFRGIHRQ
jgi:hypothetical protein